MRQEKDNIKDGGAAYSERTLPRCLYGDMAVWNRESGTFRGILMYSLPEQNPQVLQQYLESHENEDGAACQLGLGFIAASKCVARLYAGHGQKEGDASDKGYGGEDVNIQKGKGHTYSLGML